MEQIEFPAAYVTWQTCRPPVPPQWPDGHATEFQIFGERPARCTSIGAYWQVGRGVNHLKETRGLQTSQRASKFECVMPDTGFRRCEGQAIKSYAHFFAFRESLEQPSELISPSQPPGD